jgi:hypothetical protein
MARKTGYKQGAMSATDAVSQLQAASGKCDFKWMKAHAASARFFGAREADVKKALSKCPSKRSGMMGPYGFDEEDRQRLREAREATVTAQRARQRASRRRAQQLDNSFFTSFADDDVYTTRHKNGRWTSKIMDAAGRVYGSGAGSTKARAELAARRSAAEAYDRRRAGQLRPPEIIDLGGVRGTPAQHASAAELKLAIADDELAWLRYKKCRTVKGKKVCKSPLSASEKKRLRRKVDRLLDVAYTECRWVQGEEQIRCDDEVSRLDAKLKRSGMGAIRSRGVPRGGCVYVVEAGKKRKVTSDLASAKSAAKRMAQRGAAKVTKACSRGRGSDSGEVVARCTPRGCTDARGRALAGRRKRK